MLLALSISLWALVVGIRLVHLQVLGRGFFEQQGTRQSERTVNLDACRGPILDRSGRPLALP
jgi:cell division protein FtsI/penicillin-binding protein 2